MTGSGGMGSLPASRLTKILQEKADLLKKRLVNPRKSCSKKRKNRSGFWRPSRSRCRKGRSEKIRSRNSSGTPIGKRSRRSRRRSSSTVQATAAPALSERLRTLVDQVERLKDHCGAALRRKSTRIVDRLRVSAGGPAARPDNRETGSPLGAGTVGSGRVLRAATPPSTNTRRMGGTVVRPIVRARSPVGGGGRAGSRGASGGSPSRAQRSDGGRNPGGRRATLGRRRTLRRTSCSPPPKTSGFRPLRLESAMRADRDAQPIDWIQTVPALELASTQVAESLRERVGTALESLMGTLPALKEYGVDPAPVQLVIEEARAKLVSSNPTDIPKLLADLLGRPRRNRSSWSWPVCWMKCGPGS